MASGPAPSSSGARSWKDTGTARRAPESRRAVRWVWTLLGAAMLGALAWMLWPSFGRRTYIAAISIPATDKAVVPPIAYAAEDIDRLGHVPNDGFQTWRDLQQSSSLAGLGSRLAGLPAGENDALILYVNAHGVSDDGTAYLVCSDYLRGPAQGRYKIRHVLAHLGRSGASLKLLVLDTGRIAAEPRLGMVVNEFPRLLEEEVRRIDDDPALWVLVSNSVFQTAAVAHSQRQSFFALAITEALSGQADLKEEGGDDDLKVSLAELYRYVGRRLDDWFDAEGSAAETPLLMQAGKGLVSPSRVPDDLPLVMLEPAWQKAAASGDTPPAGGASVRRTSAPSNVHFSILDSRKQTCFRESRRLLASGYSPLASGCLPFWEWWCVGDAPKEAAGAGRSPLQVATDEAWRRRDRLQSRTAPGGFSPVDFAPHLWRELDALLLDYELRSRGGADFDAEKLGRQLRSLVGGLERLENFVEQGTMPPPVRADQSSIVDRLTAAWRRFLAEKEAQASFTSGPPELEKARSAVRFYDDLVFSAPDYVRWHRRAGFSADGPVPEFRDLSEMLDGLFDLGQWIDSHADRSLTASDAQELTEQHARLQQIKARLDDRLQQDGDAAVEKIAEPTYQRRVEDLLGTPLLQADRRKKLSDKLVEPGRPLPGRDRADAPPPAATLSPPRAKWERLCEQLELEQKLIRLVDPAAAGEIEKYVASLRALVRSGAGRDERLWQQSRALGKRLEAFYAALPGRIRRLAAAGPNDPARRQAERLLMLVDPRDAPSVGQRLDLFTRFRILPAPLPEKLAIAGPDQLDLDKKTWQPLSLTIQATGKAPGPVTARFDFQGDLLELRTAEFSGAVQPGKWYNVPLGPDGQATLAVELRAKTDRADQTALVVRVKTSRRTAEHRLRCKLPKPNVVDLVTRRLGSSRQQQNDGDRVRLRPFPNRATSYRFSLVNRSGEPKTVKAELIAVPEQPGAAWAPGRLFAHDGRLHRGIARSLFDPATGQLMPGAKRLATTGKPLSLPGDGSPVEIVFAPPGAAKADKPAGADGGKKAAEDKTPPKGPPPDVTHGLVCVVSNVADPQQRWIKWIEILPLAPRDYLAPAPLGGGLDFGIGYDLSKERIAVRLGPKSIEGEEKPDAREILPLGLQKKPIQVVWQTGDDLPAEAEKRDRDVLDGSKSAADLYAVVPPDDVDRIVRLTVDEYPRAFVEQVSCSETGPATDLKRTLKAIRIKSLSVAGYGREFYFAPSDKPPEAAGDEKEKKQYVYVKPDGAAAFPAPCRGIVVKFQADAPATAFQLAGREDAIEVALEVEGGRRRRFYADRQMVAHLAEFGPDGLVTLDTRLGDYTIQLDPGGLQNKRLTIVARLILSGTEVKSHPVGVVLDGLPPRIVSFHATPDHGLPLVPGGKITAQLRVTDLSGVEQVAAGFDKNRSGDLEEDEAAIVKGLGSPPAGNVWSVPLDTKGMAPGKYLLMARATDKVGHKSRARPLPVTVKAADDGGGKLEKGTIRGVAMYGRLPADRITVAIKDSGIPPQKTQGGGKFVFENVPAGSYTLEAEGSVLNFRRTGKLENVKPSPPDKPENVVIMLH